jgi:predicted ATP-dependent serine protease
MMARTASISDIKSVVVQRATTGIDHLDWLWGYTNVNGVYTWGIPRGKITLFSGTSGVGKSRVLITLAKSLVNKGRRVLYFQSEVNLEDFAGWIKDASFLRNLFCSDAATLAEQVDAINRIQPDMVIVDSINEVEDFGGGSKGNVKEVIGVYRDVVKRLQNHIILVGQLNQDGSIKGSTTLPHLVDTAFDIVPACSNSKRTIVVRAGIKNRYGRCGKEFYTYWEHTENGCFPCQEPEDDSKLDDEVWCSSHGLSVRNWAEFQQQMDSEYGLVAGNSGPKFSIGKALVRFFQGPQKY